MSLEAALDEERRDILAILEGQTARARQSMSARGRTASPAGSTQSPIRSMLDLGDYTEVPPAAPRHASVPGIHPPQRIRSMLDPMTPASPPLRPLHHSISTSPTHQPPRINLEKEFTFDPKERDPTNAVPIRASQPGQGLFGSYDKNSRSDGSQGLHGKQRSGSTKSRSPSWFGGRTTSPKPHLLNSNTGSLLQSPNTYITDSGQKIDMTNAWRRLSDANLMKAGSTTLAALGSRKGSDGSRGESLAPDGGVRLTKDYSIEDEDAVNSDSESDSDSSDFSPDDKRGRGRTRNSNSPEPSDKRQAQSLLGAAEDERLDVVSTQGYKYKSLLDPVSTGIDIDGRPTHAKRTGVHPNTNFDVADPSELPSPNDSGDEEVMDDIAKAQSLSLRVSKISSDASKYRAIRTVLRGDYSKIEEDAKLGLRRQRLYLVATDLSEEAAYALEWTIGTVLRDGDTLFAVYAMDIGDVGGDASDTHSTSSSTVEGLSAAPNSAGEGTKLMSDTYKMVRVLSNTVESTIPAEASVLDPSKAGGSEHSQSRPSSKIRFGSFVSPDSRGMGRAERERHRAVDMITDRCVHLLRKTKLQIRVIVDVVHCKSPKHIITEVVRIPHPDPCT